MGAAVQRSYSLEQIEEALTELACWHGSAHNASRALAERGVTVPSTTLQDWKRTHADRLAEIEAEILPRIRERHQAIQAVIAQRASEVTLAVIERTAQEVQEIPARDLPAAARNMEVTAATAIDKHAVINNLPTEIRQHESVEDVLNRLAQRHPGLVVESTAEEIPEVEVVSGSPEEAAQR